MICYLSDSSTSSYMLTDGTSTPLFKQPFQLFLEGDWDQPLKTLEILRSGQSLLIINNQMITSINEILIKSKCVTRNFFLIKCVNDLVFLIVPMACTTRFAIVVKGFHYVQSIAALVCTRLDRKRIRSAGRSPYRTPQWVRLKRFNKFLQQLVTIFIILLPK